MSKTQGTICDRKASLDLLAGQREGQQTFPICRSPKIRPVCFLNILDNHCLQNLLVCDTHKKLKAKAMQNFGGQTS